jgi:hypothetical protein
MFFDPGTRELLRTRPSPLTWDQARTMRGARPAGPPPRPPAEPVTAQRRASSTGVIMVAGQKIALGRIHAGKVVTVHVAAETITIDLDDQDTRTVRRTTTQPVRSTKAAQSPQGRPCFRGHPESMSWDRSVKHQVGLDKSTQPQVGTSAARQPCRLRETVPQTAPFCAPGHWDPVTRHVFAGESLHAELDDRSSPGLFG